MAFSKKWAGGSCRSLAFQGSSIVAGSHHGGVLRLRARREDAEWETPELACGLPLREADRLFQPVDTVATDTQGTMALVGGRWGIRRSKGRSEKGEKALYEPCSSKVFSDKVTLPPTWLFCSGAHEISVVAEDEAGRA